MLVPVSTDAPVYHWPWVTLSLIVTIVATFFLTIGGSANPDSVWRRGALEFGTGLYPWQWISCHFLHLDFIHLAGNMVFLWIFGLIVEGKIGWWRYLLVYFGIGVVQAFIEQLMMLGFDGPGGSMGASGIIFGLMAISLVWAPKNEISFVGIFWMFLLRIFHFDVTILTLSIFYFGLQIFFAVLGGFAISSAVIHILGAAIGFGVGVLMLKRKWVDCENWDLFAVLAGTYGTSTAIEPYLYRVEAEKMRIGQGTGNTAGRSTSSRDGRERVPAETLLSRLKYCLQINRPAAALTEYRQFSQFYPDRQLDQNLLQQLVRSLCQARLWSEAGPLMETYITRFPDDVSMRLKLAAMLVEVQHRPRYALRLLEEVPPIPDDETAARHRGRIKTRARNMIDDGVMELGGRDWS